MIREINDNGGWGEVVYSYTRQQAIEDGVLIDLSVHEIVRQHWRVNLCCTAAVWGEIQDAVENHGSDLAGVLQDLSVMAKVAIRPCVTVDMVDFRCIVGSGIKSYRLVCGPDDDGSNCLTLMKPNED